MHAIGWRSLTVLLLGLAGISTAIALVARQLPSNDAPLEAVLAADDRRDGNVQTLEALLAGIEAEDSLTRLVAVRAIGRAERSDWLEHLKAPLSSPLPTVRAAAANAIGQAVYGAPGEQAYRMLVERLSGETDSLVRGRIAQTIGRLAYASVAAAESAETHILLAAQRADELLIARGLESLTRIQRRNGYRLSENASQYLARLVTHTPMGDPDAPRLLDARVRRMALQALINAGRVDRELLERALEDADEGVRRLAMLGAASLADSSDRHGFVMEAPADGSPMVRLEIVRLFGRLMQPYVGCAPLLDAVSDPSPHVALLAVDLLANGCRSNDVVALLTQTAAALPASPSTPASPNPSWHFPAHALVAISHTEPNVLQQLLPRFVRNPQWQVRAYAARAAANVGDAATLYRLAADEHWNVRTAAIDGLHNLVGHAADSVYVAAVTADDYQLIMTAARALQGTPRKSVAVPALFASLDAVTQHAKDTSRDARRALLERIDELGSPSDSTNLAPYLSDFDPIIARAAAGTLHRWTGNDRRAVPRPLPRTPLPSVTELRRWQRTVVTLHMQGGGQINIGLRPFDAPTNVARFVRLAASGYFDKLTFHRVEPNFVIQGGSPGANEYAGDGPYTRDELTARAHWRGTVGLSTRGRDTGDGQLFVNLIDNVRLDHNYTIFGEVIAGLDVVDAVMEGAVIDSVTLHVTGEGE